MCHNNYNIKTNEIEEKRRKKSRLTYEERVLIQQYFKKGYSITGIAREINRDKSVISREIKRNSEKRYNEKIGEYEQIYRAAVAEGKYRYNKRKAGRISGIKKDLTLKTFIEVKIKENKWSPEEISGYIKKNKIAFKMKPSFQEIYYWINKKQLNISMFDLTHKFKLKKTKKHKKNKEQALSRKHKSIHLRPKIIDNNKEFGHWELDCVEGKKGEKATLLTLLERQTKMYIAIKMKQHTVNCVVKAINGLEKKYGNKFNEIFKTMTTDNGHEFLDYKRIEKSILGKGKRFELYYADPYCSWQKGMNENCNGILRRFIPKGTDISKISEYRLEMALYKINNKPRKILGFEKAEVLFKNKINDILYA